jgi:predicted small secreted protein
MAQYRRDPSMKKITAMILTLVFAFAVAACNNDDGGGDDAPAESVAASVAPAE